MLYIYSSQFFKNEPTQPTQPTQGKIRGENWWRQVGWLNSPPKMSLQVVGWSTHTPKPLKMSVPTWPHWAHEEYDGLGVFFEEYDGLGVFFETGQITWPRNREHNDIYLIRGNRTTTSANRVKSKAGSYHGIHVELGLTNQSAANTRRWRHI